VLGLVLGGYKSAYKKLIILLLIIIMHKTIFIVLSSTAQIQRSR